MCVYSLSFVRSFGWFGGSRMGFGPVVVGLEVVLLAVFNSVLLHQLERTAHQLPRPHRNHLHQLFVPVPSPLDGNSLSIIADHCEKTLGQYAGEIEQQGRTHTLIAVLAHHVIFIRKLVSRTKSPL